MTPDEVRELLDQTTPGPWYWRNTRDVYLFGNGTRAVMAFTRLGMQGAQPMFYNHETRLLDLAGKANINDYADARLIASAPEIATAYVALNKRMEHIDYCLDKWRHGALDALAEYAAARMEELDGVAAPAASRQGTNR